MRELKNLKRNPFRKILSRRREIITPPDLLSVPKESFENFVQFHTNPLKRDPNKGLESLLRTSFPFVDPNGQLEVRYIGYEIGDWECGKCGKALPDEVLGGPEVDCPHCGGPLIYKEKLTVEECKFKGLTYGAPLRVLLELVINHTDPKTGEIIPKTIKKQKIYFGEIPLLTDYAYFMINGSERIIVSQLIRSSGIFFSGKEDKTKDIITRVIYEGSVIPEKGSRVEVQYATNSEIFYAKIDRRKILGTTLLRAFGLDTTYKILKNFYGKVDRYIVEDGKLVLENTKIPVNLEELMNRDIFVTYVYEEISEKGQPVPIKQEKYVSVENLEKLLNDDRIRIEEVVTVEPQVINKSPYQRVIVETLKKDEPKINALFTFRDAALVEIYRKMRPTDTAVLDPKAFMKRAKELFNNMFADIQRYDLSRVGRVKLNAKVHNVPKTIKPLDLEDFFEKFPLLALDEDVKTKNGVIPKGTKIDLVVLEKLKETSFKEIKVKEYLDEEARTLQLADIIAIVKYLLELRYGKKSLDDIAHLGNRRVRPVGELLEAQARIGIARMQKAFRDRVATVDVEDPNLKPSELINPRYLTNSILEFLKSGQLSQFMDQTNPLSELTHKRRLSALGPGGLTRESAKFEIRDVHPSHYGRICPIETPEGQNIGLVSSMTVYSRINEFGFLISPYRKVVDGVVTNEIEYLTAYEEEKYVIAQANAEIDEKGRFLTDRVLARAYGDIRLVEPNEVHYMDISPKQVVSPSASLIPFLEHDDANRALMGSNMQRQAVPLVRTEYPLVGTGMEVSIAKDSGSVIVAKRGGEVVKVDGNTIVIKVNEDEINPHDPLDIGMDIYKLNKFKGSNQATCMNQRPLVRKGDIVEKGATIADGTSTYKGELALGKNVLVAFMPWRGYNFEDAIVISERLVKDDVFTSIHIEEFEIEARETKLGPEEITRNIPGINERQLANLDEHGVIRVGAYVKPGDILVGKVTPKGETALTPEEKLLFAIFGEKASEVKDSSLRVPVGVEGVVVDVQIFAKKKKDKKEKREKYLDTLIKQEVDKLNLELEEKKKFILDKRDAWLREILIGVKVAKDVKVAGEVIIPEGEYITENNVSQAIKIIAINPSNFIKDKKLIKKVESIIEKAKSQIELWEKIYEKRKEAVQEGADLKPGVNELVKVYIAQKRKIQVGDKMAGRHGNKGVISVVLPVEDMPFMEDGTPVDIVLNPLGVPSRMNVGQILETHLGLAAKKLGEKLGKELEKIFDREKIIDKIVEYYSIVNDTDNKILTKQRKKDSQELREALSKLDDESLRDLVRDLTKIGIPVETAIFESASEEDIKKLLNYAGIKDNGKVKLIDGRSGEAFDLEVTAGYMYMLKLIHMVDDKIHARSTGPYSLITQQPLGGRAQFGGQRFGEMEVWALEAHGAAYTLREMLTVKSDDIEGRKRVYEAIIKGKHYYDIGVPESFKVLVRELKALGLNVECIVEGEPQACDTSELEKKKPELN
ncbi:MAG TPA: DNA-directed RNA polymerase subunit beta [Sulfurihydrogenibium sp.]|uniref:DNA-directed RNA polymerase subunit beta n=1 Tax=Sulfurihydrogenibium sp. (strain YO3AOP1) TaxID=436114 RepID=UPI00017240F8|nr:DNA-directed RNA polymerase subunit beta [Sulfurihydrogenibium sp. YO3AOP1]ACD65943.1 DNA-directed RNA polymerase, beta subunit [Sulfurihydrogenibium sp. YO3AOP1]HBT98162.1 DNA-directed RNA polymerase subunit beta [Sulfurihydrogenibium sp.]